MITLVEALTRNHTCVEPVPVLLNLAAWQTDALQDWMVAEAARQHRLREHVVRDLFDRGGCCRCWAAWTRCPKSTGAGSSK
ncbi:hypothetical protein [Saccharothrix saharensis]|uniref:hypothetical protein n=1 Tax=Saccharothrix saharensis TaxID=571190 RepID=UPI00114F007E|nr:hypothetical protein [Saccharothrix saharensis]